MKSKILNIYSDLQKISKACLSSLWFKSNVVLKRQLFSDDTTCLVLGWDRKKRANMQTLQKVEISLWQRPDYEMIPGIEMEEPYNLERSKYIRIRPFWLTVKQIKIQFFKYILIVYRSSYSKVFTTIEF